MGWIRVDDSFYDNEKMLAVGCIGRDLYWHGMGFCNRNLTDGLIPKGRAVSLVDFTDAAVLLGGGGVDGQACAPIAVGRLLDADLWHEDGHDCPDCIQPGPRHYVIHDYLKYQPSKAQVEEKAEANRERVRKWSEKKQSTNAVTNALATPALTEQLHDNPNPNPNPSTSSLVTKEGGVTKRNAREAPPPICSKHGETNADSPCRACGRRREWQELQDKARALDELDERRRIKEERESCTLCDENGMVETRMGLMRCDHQAVAHA